MSTSTKDTPAQLKTDFPTFDIANSRLVFGDALYAIGIDAADHRQSNVYLDFLAVPLYGSRDEALMTLDTRIGMGRYALSKSNFNQITVFDAYKRVGYKLTYADGKLSQIEKVK